MRAPPHRRTEEIGACVAAPLRLPPSGRTLGGRRVDDVDAVVQRREDGLSVAKPIEDDAKGFDGDGFRSTHPTQTQRPARSVGTGRALLFDIVNCDRRGPGFGHRPRSRGLFARRAGASSAAQAVARSSC